MIAYFTTLIAVSYLWLVPLSALPFRGTSLLWFWLKIRTGNEEFNLPAAGVSGVQVKTLLTVWQDSIHHSSLKEVGEPVEGILPSSCRCNQMLGQHLCSSVCPSNRSPIPLNFWVAPSGRMLWVWILISDVWKSCKILILAYLERKYPQVSHRCSHINLLLRPSQARLSSLEESS